MREIESFLDEMKAKATANEPLDFKHTRDRVLALWDRAESEADRSILLGIFSASADCVERAIDKTDLLDKFRNAREADYRSLLVQESLIGEHVCVETLEKVTSREVLAGRMKHDHSLRELAVSRAAVEHPSRLELIEIEIARQSQLISPSPRNKSTLRKLSGLFKK